MSQSQQKSHLYAKEPELSTVFTTSIMKVFPQNQNFISSLFFLKNLADFSDLYDLPKKSAILSTKKKCLKRSRFFKKKYKTRNPIEKAILKYFACKGIVDTLDYDELIEQGLIFDKVPEPVNPHSLRESTKRKKHKYQKYTEPVSVRTQTKKRERKNATNPTNMNLLKIHMENRRNSGNPVILDKKEEKLEKLPEEEEKSMRNQEEMRVFPKQEQENQEKNMNQAFMMPNTSPMANFDYEKLSMIPKFNKMMMDQNQSYMNLSENDKTLWQKMFYSRLMHYQNSFDYFNPYYNSNLFGFPDRN